MALLMSISAVDENCLLQDRVNAALQHCALHAIINTTEPLTRTACGLRLQHCVLQRRMRLQRVIKVTLLQREQVQRITNATATSDRQRSAARRGAAQCGSTACAAPSNKSTAASRAVAFIRAFAYARGREVCVCACVLVCLGLGFGGLGV